MAYSANFQDLMESEYSNQQVTFKPLLDEQEAATGMQCLKPVTESKKENNTEQL
jgi:hypothetical protein